MTLVTKPLLPLTFPNDLKSCSCFVQALGILINLVERSAANRDRLMVATIPANSDDIFDSKSSAIQALIDVFIDKEASARLEEARTDEILDGKPSTGKADMGASQVGTNGIDRIFQLPKICVVLVAIIFHSSRRKHC